MLSLNASADRMSREPELKCRAPVQSASHRIMTQAMPVRTYSSFEDLPGSYDRLFEIGSRRSYCLSRPWFEGLAANILQDGERLMLIGCESSAGGEEPLALLVGRHRDKDRELRGARAFNGLSNYYSMDFAPLMAPDERAGPALKQIFRELRKTRPAYDAVRFQPLDPESVDYETLRGAMAEAGWVTRPYFLWGNWYQNIDGQSFADFMTERPAALRNTLARKAAKLETAGHLMFEVIDQPSSLERGIEAYHSVYSRSWKHPEPFPQVMTDLMRYCAGQGALRLGILSLDDTPVAAQIWIVWQGWATLYKLAHDQAHDDLSLGTILTARVLEQLIDRDKVSEIDFGAGDDPFKKDWMPRRRERWGLVGYNPRTVRGASGAVLQWALGKRSEGRVGNLTERSAEHGSLCWGCANVRLVAMVQ